MILYNIGGMVGVRHVLVLLHCLVLSWVNTISIIGDICGRHAYYFCYTKNSHIAASVLTGQ